MESFSWQTDECPKLQLPILAMHTFSRGKSPWARGRRWSWGWRPEEGRDKVPKADAESPQPPNPNSGRKERDRPEELGQGTQENKHPGGTVFKVVLISIQRIYQKAFSEKYFSNSSS